MQRAGSIAVFLGMALLSGCFVPSPRRTVTAAPRPVPPVVVVAQAPPAPTHRYVQLSTSGIPLDLIARVDVETVDGQRFTVSGASVLASGGLVVALPVGITRGTAVVQLIDGSLLRVPFEVAIS